MSSLFHLPAQSADTDERYTPKWVFDGLGLHFAIDVAAPVNGPLHTPCERWFHRFRDGLLEPWQGLVFCNPPYSQSTIWADKFIAHGNGVFLGPLANARWFRSLLAASDVVFFCDDFAFIAPTHAGKRAGMALIFAAIGAEATEGVTRLARSGRIGGQLMEPVSQSASGRGLALESLVRWLVGCSFAGIEAEDGYGRLGIGFEQSYYLIPSEHVGLITEICRGT